MDKQSSAAKNTMEGTVESVIAKKVQSLEPDFFELVNESHNHSAPKNSISKNNETHFKLLLVSESFQGLNRVQRQRKIYELLSDELKNGVHALTMRLLTPEEYSSEKESKAFTSPNCHGGSKQ